MKHPQTSAAPSDWPLPLMLDEVWLRAHRGFVHVLEGASLWPDAASQRAFMGFQRNLGEHLRDTVLLDVLSRNDFVHVSTESIFGASNRRFRRRLPFVLAFGHELGGGFYDALTKGSGTRRAEVAEACAIFNLGVSVFDLISDTDPALFAQVSTLFDAEHLSRMLGEPTSTVQLVSAAGETPTIEVRVLLKLIAAFFARLRCLVDADDPATVELRQHLASSLVAAHGAELQSAEDPILNAVDWVSVSEAKSTLPFVVIGDLAQLAAMPDAAPGAASSLASLVGHVQAVFWLTDDVADIVRDFQDGALNALLARSGAGVHRQRNPARDYPVLARLLASHVIEETIEQIREHLGAADTALQASGNNGNGTQGEHLRMVLKSYTRDWVE